MPFWFLLVDRVLPKASWVVETRAHDEEHLQFNLCLAMKLCNGRNVSKVWKDTLKIIQWFLFPTLFYANPIIWLSGKETAVDNTTKLLYELLAYVIREYNDHILQGLIFLLVVLPPLFLSLSVINTYIKASDGTPISGFMYDSFVSQCENKRVISTISHLTSKTVCHLFFSGCMLFFFFFVTFAQALRNCTQCKTIGVKRKCGGCKAVHP